LEQYLVKGFAMDDERLKQAGGGSYFDELLARIRDIRSSERVFWRRCSTFMPPASITTPARNLPRNSLPLCPEQDALGGAWANCRGGNCAAR